VAPEKTRNIIEIDEAKCDGCGQCLGGCAEGALALVEGKARLIGDNYCDGLGACLGQCPAGAMKIIQRPAPAFTGPASAVRPAAAGHEPGLAAWPIQLRLASPSAPAFDNEVLVLAADCSAFAGRSFREIFLSEGRPLLIACPKLDDFETNLQALTEILEAHPRLSEIRLPLMSVPCCGGLGRLAAMAARRAGRPGLGLRTWIVSLDGDIREENIR
jgi:Pyruvate/2-oxoacid:ferredoxin oxidoreductase delta subunit